MALVTETIRVVTTGANAGTQNYSVQVDTATGAGVNPLSIPIIGTAAGSSTIQAFMDSHSLSSNTADIVWQATNGQIAVTPYTVTAYSGPTNLRGWPGSFGSVLGTTTGVNSLVFNQVVQNYPINPFCEPNNVSGCGGGYKANPMVAAQQTTTGTGATPLQLAGTATNNSSGNFPGFILSAVTSLVVSTAGTYTFYVNYANVSSFAVYIGNGATFSSGSVAGGNGGSNPFPGTGPKSGTPLAIVSTNTGAASHPAVVSTYVTFPTPGIYTLEFVYNQFLSTQFSYDNNSYFQITYISGAQNQSVGSQGPGIGTQSFPVTAATAPPSGATPTGDLRLTPTGGTAGLKVQGQTDTLTLTIQNVPYTSIPYCPILEGTAGSLFVYNNSGNTFSFQTYNGNAVNTTAAASNVFTIAGSNTSGIFSVAPSGSAFALKYNGGAFSFIVPGSQISTTNLTLTADDIAWYFATNQSFDLFTPVSGSGGTAYSIAVDFMTKPTVKNVSPATLNATGVAQAITINLSKPFSPQQQGLYGTGNTITAIGSISGGATISTLTPILDSASYLQGWSATVTPAVSSTNGSLSLSLTVSGTLTYLSGTTFTTGTVTYISGVVATIPTVGDQFVPPVAVSLTVTPGGSPLSTNQTLAGTVYTFDNNPQTMVFYQKSTASGSSGVALGTGVLTNSYTGTVGGKTAYYKTYSLSHAFSTISVTSVTQAEIYLGFVDTDTANPTQPTTYYSTTVYTQPFTIITVCFTGNVAIKLPGGVYEQMALLPRDKAFEIENETGIHLAKLIVHEDYDGEMVEFLDGKLVTPEHPMKVGTEWLDADVKWLHKPRVNFHGTVYNLHVLSDNPEDQHYILETGDIAHNKAEVCFSPNTLVQTQRGDIAISEVIEGKDKVLTARGTWKTIEFVTTRLWYGPMLDMGDGELSTPTHYVKHEGTWKPMEDMGLFPAVHYEGTIHNLHIRCDQDDDGTALDTEHSYTLANGLVVHNITTVV